MKMSAADRATYPALYRYIRYAIPNVKTVGAIVNNLRIYGTLSAGQSAHALTWGNDPLVNITPLSANQCGVPAANGCFDPVRPDEIQIDTSRALEFEAGGAPASEAVRGGARVSIVGTTLLHELCHWGRHRSGVAYPAGEEGVDFEVATYGHNVG